MNQSPNSTPEREQLQYPFEAPNFGEFLEVLPGVRLLRLPLPYKLDSINVWAIDDGDGWTLVDTGTWTEKSMAIWDHLLSEPFFDRPLKRVVATHMHPDHVGMAGFLTRKYGVSLFMPRLEYLTCRTLVSDTGCDAPEDGLRFYREAGWSPAALDVYKARFGGYGKFIYKLPDSYSRIEDGQIILIGDHYWEVITGAGHSPEHACLYCSELKVLISGDQVLPRISPNVSVYPTEPEANPMAEYLTSIETLLTRVPSDVLVLPSHQDCFFGLHERIKKITLSQNLAIDRLRILLTKPQRVCDVFVALFNRPITEADPIQLQFATGEALACLNYLIYTKEVRKEVKSEVAWYSLC